MATKAQCFTVMKILIFNIILSLFDVGSDVVNGIDMIRGSLFSLISGEVSNTSSITVLQNITNNTSNITSQDNDLIWGSLSIAIIFLPGIPVALFTYFYDVKKIKSYPKFFATLFAYPVYNIITQFMFICKHDNRGKQVSAQRYMSCEGFFEACPQLILQGFTILYGREITEVQTVSMIISLCSLANAGIQLDAVVNTSSGSPPTGLNKVLYTLSVLPIFLLCIVFRALSLVLIAGFLRYYAIIPVTVIFIILVVISKMKISYSKYWENTILRACANIGTMTLADGSGEGIFDNDITVLYYSSISTYSILSILLLGITLTSNIVSVEFRDLWFPHWQDLLLNPNDLIYCTVALLTIGLIHIIIVRVYRKDLVTWHYPGNVENGYTPLCCYRNCVREDDRSNN